ncbi:MULTISPECIES: NAD(P)-dependent oxidoreductase [unclassified Streptomyces]|uniref:NAD(P)-dependent oxidoreductase n=1 Tax=unclassified Streptomyces TaxID=2593676 RepID=UPI0037FF9513
MRLAVFGAGGHLGRRLVPLALAAGHEVTVLVRNPVGLSGREGLRILPGDVRDPRDVDRVVEGADAVLSALGTRPPRGGTICAEAMRRILPAMRGHGVRRLVVVGAYGTGQSHRGAYRAVMSLALPAIMRDKDEQDALVRAEGDLWTIVQPAVLTTGRYSGVYRTGTDLRLGLASRVSRADVADFMLRAAGSEECVRRAVAITS